MPNGKEQAEKDRHAAEKAKIKDKRDFDLTADLHLEGVGEGLLISIVIAIEAIIALLLTPEPLISKGAAIGLAIGVGALTVFLVIAILVMSKVAITRIWEEFQQKETAEDNRHREAMGQ
jgi:hypothetical protein